MKKVNKLTQKLLKMNRERQTGICGQAFTNYNCLVCEDDFSHPNTCTPMICPNCTTELKKELKDDEDEK
jgi:hypothetical protein